MFFIIFAPMIGFRGQVSGDRFQESDWSDWFDTSDLSDKN